MTNNSPYQALQVGMYKSAMTLMDHLHVLVRRNLRANQYLSTYSGLMKLKRVLRRCDAHFEQQGRTLTLIDMT
jgi:hypothetical protein